jgi:hypothetical protein
MHILVSLGIGSTIFTLYDASYVILGRHCSTNPESYAI